MTAVKRQLKLDEEEEELAIEIKQEAPPAGFTLNQGIDAAAPHSKERGLTCNESSHEILDELERELYSNSNAFEIRSWAAHQQPQQFSTQPVLLPQLAQHPPQQQAPQMTTQTQRQPRGGNKQQLQQQQQMQQHFRLQQSPLAAHPQERIQLQTTFGPIKVSLASLYSSNLAVWRRQIL